MVEKANKKTFSHGKEKFGKIKESLKKMVSARLKTVKFRLSMKETCIKGYFVETFLEKTFQTA